MSTSIFVYMLLVSEFLAVKGECTDFEGFPEEKLCCLLREFYGSLRNKDGDHYSKSSYVNIRASLNRHITSPPFNRQINLMRDRCFMTANHVFNGLLRTMKEAGKDRTTHKTAIREGDMERLYTTGVLSDLTPLSLIRKVFVEISINFGRCGREGLRQLSKHSIVIKVDDRGREFATIDFNELDKTHQTSDLKHADKSQIMYSQEQSEFCPVKSLKKYISKLHPACEAFFQKPKVLPSPEEHECWYYNRCLGVHKLDGMMKDISVAAGLSKIYTNHCLRATAATILSHAGFDFRNISSVTGHRNIQSLTSYVRAPSMDQRKSMCNTLHNFGKSEETNSVKHDEGVLALPPASSEGVLALPTTTSECSVVGENVGQSQISNVAVKSDSVFAGANFYGQTTINLMLNKK